MRLEINVEDNGNKSFETIGSLIKDLEQAKKYAIENNELEEFMNTKVELQLEDINGVILCGLDCLNVGVCKDNFILVGNIQDVFGL